MPKYETSKKNSPRDSKTTLHLDCKNEKERLKIVLRK